jgi:hypothetical protein
MTRHAWSWAAADALVQVRGLALMPQYAAPSPGNKLSRSLFQAREVLLEFEAEPGTVDVYPVQSGALLVHFRPAPRLRERPSAGHSVDS